MPGLASRNDASWVMSSVESSSYVAMATNACESAAVSSATLAGNTSIDFNCLEANSFSRSRSAVDLVRSVMLLGQAAPSAIH